MQGFVKIILTIKWRTFIQNYVDISMREKY